MSTCTYNPPIKVPANSRFRMDCYYSNAIYHDAVMCWSLMAGVNHATWDELKLEFGSNNNNNVPLAIAPPQTNVNFPAVAVAPPKKPKTKKSVHNVALLDRKRLI